MVVIACHRRAVSAHLPTVGTHSGSTSHGRAQDKGVKRADCEGTDGKRGLIVGRADCVAGCLMVRRANAISNGHTLLKYTPSTV